MNPTQSVEPSIAKHFTILVYPFRHALSGGERAARLHALNDRWQPWWGRLEEKALQHALDDTHFFLPYIRELFFPETTRLRPADLDQQADQAAWLTGHLSLPQIAEKPPADAIVRAPFRRGHCAALVPGLRAA